jgi:predicted dehydrogenase
MLADPKLDAVIIATADQFHVALCKQAIAAGKPVLVEKPLGVSVEECLDLREAVRASGVVFQVGYNKHFDPGIAFARQFIQEELGERLSYTAWYRDSAYRYSMTDSLQPIPFASPNALRPGGNPKADKRRYFVLTHGSHLVDSARWLGGEIESVHARLVEKAGAYCWFIAVDFADGSQGHLDLTVAVKGDWAEGFHVYGEKGSVIGKVHLPWYFKTAEVECFSTEDRVFRRPLGEDAHSYKLQIEGFVEAIRNPGSQTGANVDDGVEGVRALVAIARSVERGERVRLADVTGSV